MKSLLRVAAWDLRRATLDRSLWLFLGGVFAFCLAMTWFKHAWARPVVDGHVGETINILGTTQIGLPYLVIELLLPLVGLAFPFVAGDGVARDYARRLHELVMASAIPTWAFMLGRFAATLLLNLALSVALLVAVVLDGLALRAIDGYPLPSISLLLAVWGVAVVPATFVLTSVSFVLGAFAPKLSNGLKLAMVTAWLVLVFMVDAWDRGATWFTYWNPTGYGIVRINVDAFLQRYQTQVVSLPDPSLHPALALRLQQLPVDLGPWVGPHAVLGALSLALVGFAAARFTRFQAVLG